MSGTTQIPLTLEEFNALKFKNTQRYYRRVAWYKNYLRKRIVDYDDYEAPFGERSKYIQMVAQIKNQKFIKPPQEDPLIYLWDELRGYEI